MCILISLENLKIVATKESNFIFTYFRVIFESFGEYVEP